MSTSNRNKIIFAIMNRNNVGKKEAELRLNNAVKLVMNAQSKNILIDNLAEEITKALSDLKLQTNWLTPFLMEINRRLVKKNIVWRIIT